MPPRRVIGIDAGGTKLLGGVVDDPGNLRHAVDGLLDVVQVDELTRRPHVVDGAVDLLDQGQDVLPVERGDDARVQAFVDGPNELIAPVLGWSKAQTRREVEHYLARVEAERLSQEQPDDHTADTARLGAPEIVPLA